MISLIGHIVYHIKYLELVWILDIKYVIIIIVIIIIIFVICIWGGKNIHLWNFLIGELFQGAKIFDQICYYVQVISIGGGGGGLVPLKSVQLYSICIFSYIKIPKSGFL